MDMIQDWMIINKIKMGDPDAWDILVHKYYDSVYFYCVRRCYGDCDIASDLTQDIFLKLVESLPIAILLISANSRCVEPPFAIVRTYCF